MRKQVRIEQHAVISKFQTAISTGQEKTRNPIFSRWTSGYNSGKWDSIQE